MERAYDKVSWIFLTKVLRQFDFLEIIIDMVWTLMINNLIGGPMVFSNPRGE